MGRSAAGDAVRAFFRDTPGIMRRHPVYAFLLFVLCFVLFGIALELTGILFRHVLVDNFLGRLSQRSTLLGIGVQIHSASGDPLLKAMQPLIMHLGLVLGFALSTVFSGLIMERLSLSSQSILQPGVPLKKGRWLFGARQELRILSVNLSWAGALMVVSYLSPGSGLSRILFYLLTPIVYALSNLSYPMLRSRRTYYQMFRAALHRPLFFYVYALCSASGYFAVLLIMEFAPAGLLSSVLVFGLFALFRPFGVISGTGIGLGLLEAYPPAEPRAGARIMGGFFTIAALLVLITLGQFAHQASTKIDLVDAGYRVHSIGLEGPGGEGFAGLAAAIMHPAVVLELELSNPLPRTLYLEAVELQLISGGAIAARGAYSGGELAPGAVQVQRIRVSADTAGVVRGLVDLALHKKDISIKAVASLDLWFGTLPYVFWHTRI